MRQVGIRSDNPYGKTYDVFMAYSVTQQSPLRLGEPELSQGDGFDGWI